jgi:hypothetical protein
MKITNKLGLPSAFVNLAASEYTYTPKRYSVTSLLKPTRELILSRRYHSLIEQDVSEMIWLLFGKAVHYILEHHADKDEYAEMRVSHTLENGYTISGIIDLYSERTARIVDYKTASVYKVILGDFADWRGQAMLYGWILHKMGKPIKEAVFYAILKDHSKRAYKQAKFRGEKYPEKPVHSVHFRITKKDIYDTEQILIAKMEEIIRCEQLSDSALPACTPEERWATPEKWAVYKTEKAARATRLFDSEHEAQKHAAENDCKRIEFRPGESRRCEYCSAAQFCDFAKGIKNESQSND